MENLLLYPDSISKAPVIDFKTSGELSITGRSVSENITEYFRPVFDWIGGLMDSPPATIMLTIKLEYLNSKSSRIILHILKMLEQIYIQDKSKVQVTWLFEEDDLNLYEAGNVYKSIVNIPFKLCSFN
jgi:hypothetical protein